MNQSNQNESSSQSGLSGQDMETRETLVGNSRQDIDKAVQLISVGIQVETSYIDDVIGAVIDKLVIDKGLRLRVKTEPFKCRFPDETESKVYLQFEDDGEK